MFVSASAQSALPIAQLSVSAPVVVRNGTPTVIGELVPASLTGATLEDGNVLVAPVAGTYDVAASLAFEEAGGTVPAGTYETQVWVTGRPARAWSLKTYGTEDNGALGPSGEAVPTPGGSSLLRLRAGAHVELVAWQGSGTTVGVGWDAPGQGAESNYLSLFLVAQ